MYRLPQKNAAMKQPENIGFVSTRFAGTDGVSLESAKWAEVLWHGGHVSFWYAGVLDRDPAVSLCIPEAFFDHAENAWINAQLWGRTRRSADASRRIRELAEYLKTTLYEFRDRFDLDILIIQNAVTIPMHIPLGVAITEFLLETGMPAIAHHHDFQWERQRFQISAVDDYLEMAFPPRVPHLQHVVINQSAREEIAWRKGLPSVLVPNVFDFENPPGEPDDYAADVRSALGLLDDDLLILQPTRIVPPSLKRMRPEPWTWRKNLSTGSSSQTISSPRPASTFEVSISPRVSHLIGRAATVGRRGKLTGIRWASPRIGSVVRTTRLSAASVWTRTVRPIAARLPRTRPEPRRRPIVDDFKRSPFSAA